MKYFYIICLLLLLHPIGNAADINIQLSQHSFNNQITVTIANKASQDLLISKLRLVLNKKTYWIKAEESIKANQSKHYNFLVDMPKAAGSYAQAATLFYFNEGRLFSLSDVGYFNYQITRQFNDNALFEARQSGNKTLLNLSAPDASSWSIIVPQEVSATDLNKNTSREITLKGIYSGFNTNYPVFAVKEGMVDNQHYAKILRTNAFVKHHSGNQQSNYQRGRLSNLALLIISLISILLFLYYKNNSFNKRYISSTMLLLFLSRLIFLSIAYILLKNANVWLGFSSVLSEHFSGKNYRYFFLYFIDAYYLAFVCLYLPFLMFIENSQRFTELKNSIAEDKYIAVLLWLIQPILKLLRPLEKRIDLSRQARHKIQSPLRTGWLLLAVKFFFLPFLASWVIGNFIHQWNLIQSFNWTFHQINAFILALLILTDTSIFLFGYMFESSQLGSKVRSVEPTILGWLVCLWCYPPFNTFSFIPFDINFVNIYYPVASWAEPIVLISITLLWGIFVWGSIALGFKASNLTNRGIISSGPYKYCRHPAYTAKIAVWLIEAVFLGKYFIGLFLGFLIIYFLRAITEERHLSLDPDYQAYKKKVPYRFIPGII